MIYDKIHSSEIFPDVIKLYRLITTTDTTRNIPQRTLDLTGQFKAYVETVQNTQPLSTEANISYISKVYVRASQFYRHSFNANNFIEHEHHLMRISSTLYHRPTGITQCMCYEINPENLGTMI